MQAGKRRQEDAVTVARQFSEVIHTLLLVVPMNSLLPVSDTVMADVDEDEDSMQAEASTSGTSGQQPSLLQPCTPCFFQQSKAMLHQRRSLHPANVAFHIQ